MPNALTPADDDDCQILVVHLHAGQMPCITSDRTCLNHVTVTPPLVKDVQPVDDVVRSTLGRSKAVE
jgi:hypothetical protein